MADHDQRFKALIREFFAEFIQLFFADWAARFDFDSVEWLDTELHADPPEGGRHLLDLVAKLKTTLPPTPEAEEWIALVHIEIESPDRTTALKPHLPGYYLHLRERYGLPVLPIVLYLKVGMEGIGIDTVVERIVDFEPLTFRYLYVGLPGLNAEPFLRGENPLGIALSALMKIPREKILEWGVEALRRIDGLSLTEQKRYLLGDCVEAYIDVDDSTLAAFHNRLERNATGRLKPMNKTRVELAEERGEQKGRQEGRQEGLILATRAVLRELLEAKYGSIPEELENEISEEGDVAALRKWIVCAGKESTLEAFLETVD